MRPCAAEPFTDQLVSRRGEFRLNGGPLGSQVPLQRLLGIASLRSKAQLLLLDLRGEAVAPSLEIGDRQDPQPFLVRTHALKRRRELACALASTEERDLLRTDSVFVHLADPNVRSLRCHWPNLSQPIPLLQAAYTSCWQASTGSRPPLA